MQCKDHFIFNKGDGVDRVVDMSLAQDVIELGAALWGGLAKTAAEVVSDFATIRAGHVVLDFGLDELHLLSLTATTGLESRIQIV